MIVAVLPLLLLQALSADANCTVIIWAFHAAKPDELMAQRDLSLGGPYVVIARHFKFGRARSCLHCVPETY